MDTDIRSSSQNHNTTGTAISVSEPAGAVAGDLIVVSVHVNTQTTIVDNNGATPYTEEINDYKPNTTAGHTVSVFKRRKQAGDPATLNFTSGATGRWSVIAVAIKNPDPTSEWDVAPSTANAANRDDSSTNTITAPAINTTLFNSIHIVIGYADDATTTVSSHPTGYTAINTSTDEPQGMSYKKIHEPGSTGTTTYTFSASQPQIALSFAVRMIKRIKDPVGGGQVAYKRQ